MTVRGAVVMVMGRCPVQSGEKAGRAVPVSGAVHYPLLWLAVIVGVGFVFRLWYVTDSLQIDEFGPLYAIAERATAPADFLPSSADPLLPVASWQEVRARSVLPYGIVHPFPVYHYLLYGVIHVLPITEWTLRLPSLLAGLGCIVAVYGMCRRLLGVRGALLASLLVAIDPMQIGVGVIARPYALGSLLCILSFDLLWLIFHPGGRPRNAVGAVGYAVVMAGIGYLNPALLLVGSAHAGMVIYWALAQGRAHAPWMPASAEVGRNEFTVHPPPSTLHARRAFLAGLAWWMAGCVLGGLLLLPLASYCSQVGDFTRANRSYLHAALISSQVPLLAFLLHNSALVVGLNVLTLGGYLRRRTRADVSSNAGHEPERGREVLWLGTLWVIVPQLVALALAYGAGQPVFLPRYLSYTASGGAILVAFRWSTFDPSRFRVGLTAGLVVGVCLLSLTEVSRGAGLLIAGPYRSFVSRMDRLDDEGLWRPGDVVLLRPRFLEADFFPKRIPLETRASLKGVLAAPGRTLYATRNPKPFLLLSWSQYSKSGVQRYPGRYFPVDDFYDESFAKELRPYRRFWYCPDEGDSNPFVACFLPWLASALGEDISVEYPGPRSAERLNVQAHQDPKEIANRLDNDMLPAPPRLLLIQRKSVAGRPQGSELSP